MKLLIAMVCVLMFLSIVAFAQDIKISFWHAFSPKSMRGKALQLLVDEFNQKGFKVNGKKIFVDSIYKGGQGSFNNPYNFLFSELLKASYEKKLPHVSIAYENWVSQFYEVDVIRDFDSFNNTEIKDYINNLYPDFRRSSEIDGKVYSLSFNKSLFVMYYNSKYVDSLPTDFNKFIMKLEEMRKRTGIAPLYLEPNEDAFIILYLLSVSDEFFQMGSKIQPLFLGENLQRVTRLVNELESKGLIKWTDNSYEDFIKNRAPMILATTSKYTDLKMRSQDYYISPLPADSGKIYAAGTNLVIFKSTQEDELASLEFIRYLLDPVNLEKFCISTGYIVPTMSYSNVYSEFLDMNPDYKKVLEYSKDRIYVQQPVWAWENVRYFLNDYMLSVFVNKLSVELQQKDLEEKVKQIMVNQNLKYREGG
ncbi:MAG: extracellular solute-binding protein [bacterium]|nr:extracellular solute-binding protein [bacterium]